LFQGHFRQNLLPARGDFSRRGLSAVIVRHLRFSPASEEEARSYNVLQRLTYLMVIFVLFPLVIWMVSITWTPYIFRTVANV